MERSATFAGSRRILHFLANGPASVRPASRGENVLLEATGRGSIAVESGTLSKLAAKGLLARSSHSVALSAQGSVLAQHLGSSSDALQDRHRDIDLVSVDLPAGPAMVVANLAESPLSQLVRRKGRDGKPFLGAREFQAGERLRSDYTRGQIMPRLGANWGAGVSSGKRASGGGLAELTDAALAARQRVDNAMQAVGPELSGVLVDVCCFLKGLELVEAERGWPVRSAKIVLKTALGVLARHYVPDVGADKHKHRQTLHWGTSDYRPKMTVS